MISKLKLLFITLFITLNGFSQIEFEKGYFINTKGEKIECFIKNRDWSVNPKSIKYKLTQEGEAKKIIKKNLQEFRVGEQSYEKHTIKVDKSEGDTSSSRYFNFIDETVILKVLSKGKATLYKYLLPGNNKFFYSTKDIPIKQLLYKNYLRDDNKVSQNLAYKQEIKNLFKCHKIKDKDILFMTYNTKPLTNFFEKYNNCDKIEDTKTKTSFFNKEFFRIRAITGVNFTSMKLNAKESFFINKGDPESIAYKEIELGKFDIKSSFTFGIEIESILNFNKRKWGVFLSGLYKGFEGTSSSRSTVEFKQLEFNLGGRHYLYLNKRSRFFIGANISLIKIIEPKLLLLGTNGLNLITNSDNTFIDNGQRTIVLEGNNFPTRRFNFSYGIGFERDFFQIQLNHYPSSSLPTPFEAYNLKYNYLNLSLGFDIIGFINKNK